MLSPKRKALYSEVEMAKDQKGLCYQNQVSMIKIAPSKTFPEPPKENDEDTRTEEGDETVKPAQEPFAFEERARHPGRAHRNQSWLRRRATAYIQQWEMSPKEKMYISSS